MTPRLRTPDPRPTRPNLRRVLATVIAVLMAVLAYQTLGPTPDDSGVELSTASVFTGPSRLRSTTAVATTPTPVPTTAPLVLPSPTPPPPPTVVEERAARSADTSRVAVAQAAAVAPEPTDVAATPQAPTVAATGAPAAPAQQAPTSPPVVAPANPTPLPATPVPIEPTAVIVATPAPTSTPIPTPASPPANSSGLVYYVLGEINSVRAKVGLPPLTLSPELSSIAASWSAQMAVAGNISHRPASQLTSMMPPGWRMWAENVATAPDIYWAQSALEGSPGHYANMVGASFTQVGIGIAFGDYGSVWITQNFATY